MISPSKETFIQQFYDNNQPIKTKKWRYLSRPEKDFYCDFYTEIETIHGGKIEELKIKHEEELDQVRWDTEDSIEVKLKSQVEDLVEQIQSLSYSPEEIISDLQDFSI